ncbi:MAG: ribosome maturation factor RimM [Synergistota bacterium]|nr:ribosome maturation factor RimM [Synergistota bacterium]
MKGDDLVEVGKIIAPHGVKGEFKVFPLTDFPDRFESMDELDLYDGKGRFVKTVPISSVRFRPDKGEVMITSPKIRDRDEAEALRGMLVKVSKDQRRDLPEGEYWIDDLIGLSVIDEGSGESIGTLCDVMVTGGSDVYAVKRPDGRDMMIPAVGVYVSSVDIASGVLKVKNIEGLRDL